MALHSCCWIRYEGWSHNVMIYLNVHLHSAQLNLSLTTFAPQPGGRNGINIYIYMFKVKQDISVHRKRGLMKTDSNDHKTYSFVFCFSDTVYFSCFSFVLKTANHQKICAIPEWITAEELKYFLWESLCVHGWMGAYCISCSHSSSPSLMVYKHPAELEAGSQLQPPALALFMDPHVLHPLAARSSTSAATKDYK